MCERLRTEQIFKYLIKHKNNRKIKFFILKALKALSFLLNFEFFK